MHTMRRSITDRALREPILELDDGVKLTLRPGDTYVQNGTRHRWSNKGDMPASWR